MTLRQFLVFLARKVAILAYAIGYEETAYAVNRATVEYQETQEGM